LKSISFTSSSTKETFAFFAKDFISIKLSSRVSDFEITDGNIAE